MRSFLLPVVLLLLLVACDQPAPPQPAPTSIPTRTALVAIPPPSPTPATDSALPATSTATLLIIGPVPTAPGSPVASNAPTPPEQVPVAQAVATDKTEFANEVAHYFTEYFQTQTLQKEGMISGNWVRGVAEEPYLDYVVAQVKQVAKEAEAGKTIEVTYSNITTHVDSWQPSEDGKGTADVMVKRTRHVTRKGGAPVADTATMRFKLQRHVANKDKPGDAAWRAFDFYDTKQGKWVSQNVPAPPQDVKTGVADFFRRFYEARSITPGHKIDTNMTEQLVLFAYHDYEMPILQAQQAEVDQGKLTGVTYSNIKTEVTAWYPEASDHGGLAIANVTRTKHVVRPSASEQATTETYQFRLHRHHNEDPGIENRWVAIDFLNPASGKWTSEAAGMISPLPLASTA